MRAILTTTKLSQAALRLARLIAASTGEKQYEVLERVLKTDAARLGLGGARRPSPFPGPLP